MFILSPPYASVFTFFRKIIPRNCITLTANFADLIYFQKILPPCGRTVLEQCMKEFFTAALPWVAIGLSIALLSVNHSKQKKRRQDDSPEQRKKSTDNHMTDGMCIGMCIGALLGSTGVVPLGTGISFGMLLGLCFGMMIQK
jgi:membrane glycosyltransferase